MVTERPGRRTWRKIFLAKWWQRRRTHLVLLVWAAIYLPGLGSLEIRGEEGRRAAGFHGRVRRCRLTPDRRRGARPRARLRLRYRRGLRHHLGERQGGVPDGSVTFRLEVGTARRLNVKKTDIYPP